MALAIPETTDLIRSLQSDLCPMCGGWKHPGHTMCLKDYRSLPSGIKRSLYNRIGEGYEEAIQEAMVSLGKEEFKLK